MTVDGLKLEAGLTLALLEVQAETIGRVEPICIIHWPINPAQTFPRISGLLRLATPGQWKRFPIPGPVLDSGDMKQILFDFFRGLVRQTNADGIIFATDMWAGKVTPEGMKHIKEIDKHVDRGFEKLVRKGWVTRGKALQVTAQTATDVVMMQHGYQRRSSGAIQWLGETRSIVAPQSAFSGRQKMFGVFTRDTLGEPPEGSPL